MAENRKGAALLLLLLIGGGAAVALSKGKTDAPSHGDPKLDPLPEPPHPPPTPAPPPAPQPQPQPGPVPQQAVTDTDFGILVTFVPIPFTGGITAVWTTPDGRTSPAGLAYPSIDAAKQGALDLIGDQYVAQPWPIAQPRVDAAFASAKGERSRGRRNRGDY